MVPVESLSDGIADYPPWRAWPVAHSVAGSTRHEQQMLEAGEIVLATLGVGVLFLLCICGICSLLLSSEKKKQPQSRMEEAMPPERPQIREQAVGTTTMPPGRRRRRDSGTQTEENADVVVEEDLRSDSTIVVARPTALTRKLRTAAAPAEAVTTQHNTSEFASDLNQLRQSSHSVFEDEFEILRRRAVSRWKSREVAAMNPRKNRFEDAVPYDDNRVQLSGGEYINASYIDSYLSAKHFIATQWPISSYELPGREATLDDFWKMVWERRVNIIVALSGKMETMTAYWPPQRSVRRFGDVKVEQTQSYDEGGLVVRHFTLENRKERTEVTQYHISDWEDGDVTDGKIVLKLANNIKHSEKPIVVHCSAGIGRSGVFIAVCRLLDQAKQRGLIDVFSVVDSMRQQRAGMVQTRTQYESIYEILRTAVENKPINDRF